MIQFHINLTAKTVAEALAMRAELLAAGVSLAPFSAPIVRPTLSPLGVSSEETALRDDWKAETGKRFRMSALVESFSHPTHGQGAIAYLRAWKAGELITESAQGVDEIMPEDSGEEII